MSTKPDLKAENIDTNYWEDKNLDRTMWREMFTKKVKDSEKTWASVMKKSVPNEKWLASLPSKPP